MCGVFFWGECFCFVHFSARVKSIRKVSAPHLFSHFVPPARGFFLVGIRTSFEFMTRVRKKTAFSSIRLAKRFLLKFFLWYEYALYTEDGEINRSAACIKTHTKIGNREKYFPAFLQPFLVYRRLSIGFVPCLSCSRRTNEMNLIFCPQCTQTFFYCRKLASSRIGRWLWWSSFSISSTVCTLDWVAVPEDTPAKNVPIER